jgi:hypothetical protein
MQRGEFLTLVASAEVNSDFLSISFILLSIYFTITFLVPSLGCGVVLDDLHRIFSIFPPFLLSPTA